MSTEFSLLDRLQQIAQQTPQKQAIVTKNYTLTYAQLTQLVFCQIEKLSELNIDEQSVVGIRCANDTYHMLLCLAASYLGATSCVIPSYDPQPAQDAIASRVSVTHILDENHAVELNVAADEKIPVDLDSACKDSRLLFSSSGTTGEPKLVVHHATDIVAQAHRHISSSSERFLCLASMEHNFAKRHRLYCLAQGATNVFINTSDDAFTAMCQTLEVGVIHVSIFQAQRLLAIPNISELSQIRLKLGGSHATQSLRQKLRQEITQNLQAGYGTTETGAICFTDPDVLEAKESVGQPLPGIEMRVVSQDKAPLPTGEKGEIAIRCKGMFRSYLGNPELTESNLQDGWFYTGDIGYLDDQQRVYLCGRADDMFVFNSINIYPQDIESLLCKYPAVSEVAVVPKHSAVHGQIPVALVVFDGKESHLDEMAKLRKFAHSHLGLRCPQQFIALDQVPRSASGKVSRLDAQNISVKNDEVRSAIVQNLQSNQALDGVKSTVIEGFEKGEQDILLRDLQMDSIVQMNLLVALETAYDRVIMPQKFSRLKSLNDLVDVVLSAPEQQFMQKNDEATEHSSPSVEAEHEVPYIVKFFRRVFRRCSTVAELNRALTSFEYRITPLEIHNLDQWQQNKNLLPSDAEQKVHTVLEDWLTSLKGQMLASEKQQPEPYVFKRVRPMLSCYTGPGETPDKTLVICFSIARSRQMMIPNTVLMQHADASRFDLLMVGTFSAEGFDNGVPLLGNNTLEIIDFIKRLDFVHQYKEIRTMGCSAGAPIAVLLANGLNAELSVSLGARFHRVHHPVKIVRRMCELYKGKNKNHKGHVIYSYSEGRIRDTQLAKFMRSLFGGVHLVFKEEGRKFSHTVLEDLLASHKLNYFFDHTIFADPVEQSLSRDSVLEFPSGTLAAIE